MLTQDRHELLKDFILAAGKGKLDRVRACLEKARLADFDIMNLSYVSYTRSNNYTGEADTALTCAANNGRKDMVFYLLREGARPAASDSRGKTARDWALHGNHIEIAQILKDAEAGVMPAPEKDPAADASTSQGRKLVKKLVKAAKKGDLEKVIACITAGADINGQSDPYWSSSTNYTALIAAVIEEHLDVVKLLIKSGASLTVTDSGMHLTAEQWAINKDHGEIYDMLYAARQGQNPIPVLNMRAPAAIDDFMEAAKAGNVAKLKRYLQSGMEVNTVCGDFAWYRGENLYHLHSVTALHVAAYFGASAAVSVLLAAGADPAALEGKGRTPLQMARMEGRVDVALLLPDAVKPPPAAVPVSVPVSLPPPPLWQREEGEPIMAHTRTLRTLNRELTEIFNFATRQMTLINRNLQTNTESTAAPVSFDALERKTLEEAFNEFKKQGGDADERYVFHGNAPGLPKERKTANG